MCVIMFCRVAIEPRQPNGRCLTSKGAMTMVHFGKSNGDAKSKLKQDDPRALQDHELDRVSGGVGEFPDNLMAILEQQHQRGVERPSPGCPRL
jgi:hypothetical protein